MEHYHLTKLFLPFEALPKIYESVYDELEKEGFIYTIAAKGCFVAPLNTDLLRETNLKKIEDYMEKIVHLAASCNLSEQELTEMLHFMMEE